MRLRVGLPVYDRYNEMPGFVKEILSNGRSVLLVRPHGFEWTTSTGRLDPASEREKRQLAALERLHKQATRLYR